MRIYTKPIQAQRIEFMFDHEFLNDKKIFSKNWKKKFDIMLKERYQGKIKYHTAKDAYYKKKLIDKNEFIKIFKLKKKKFKRVVFFAPHCFSDANHRAGRLIFDDYYAQFQNTIKLAKKDKDSLWIVKIHPQRLFFSVYVKLSEKKILSENENCNRSVAKPCAGFVTCDP